MSSRHAKRHPNAVPVFQTLERRVLLCALHTYEPIIEERPDLIDPKTGISPPNITEVLDPANIVWVNRGQASDNFNARFGTTAGRARAVVDAVIDYFELMIGSFDYPTAGQVFNLTLSMGASGGGFGASASLNTSLGGKPKSGSVTMGAGNGSTDPNDDNGWFLDPTPYDNSEFMGNIVNAFAGDAQVGSPAFGRADFFTVVALELAHCVGLYGNSLAGWQNRTTDTGVADTAEGGGIGTFWTFNGNSINHLLTSNNGGPNGQNWGSAIHSAGPGVTVPFGVHNYIGADDIGNALYENGRRYMVNNTMSLMLKDAYGYRSINPARFGTFYSSPFSSTGVVTVRGGAGNSADNIQIFRSPGNTITVSVDVGDDIPGTGALPGAGGLPAFVSVYDVHQVSSIVVNSGGGDDVIFLDTTDFSQGITQPITINGGSGNDTLTLAFFGGRLDYLLGPVTFNGDLGVDSIVLYDNAATASDTYTITSSTLSRTNFGGLTYLNSESLHLNGQSGNNTFNINSTLAAMSLSLDGRGGNDTFHVAPTSANLDHVAGPIQFNGGPGTDTVVFADYNSTQPRVYAIGATTINRTGNGQWSFTAIENRELYGGQAADILIVASTLAGTTTKLAGHLSDDTFVVGAGTAGASLVDGSLQLFGEAGNDALVFDDRLNAMAETYIVSAANITRTGAAAVSYNSIELVAIDAGLGADTVRVVDHAPNVSVALSLGAGLDKVEVNSDGVGVATVRFDGALEDLASLDIFAGGTAVLTPGGNKIIDTDAFNIAETGKLDLNDNALIVDYTEASPLASIRAALTSGFNSGLWTGNGINSSLAGSISDLTLGYAESSAIFTSFPAIFAGREVDNTAVLVRCTRPGDANLDRTVNLADFNRLAANFGSGTLWSQGNFNYDNTINLADFNLLASRFGSALAFPARGSVGDGTVLDGTLIKYTNEGDATLEGVLNLAKHFKE